MQGLLHEKNKRETQGITRKLKEIFGTKISSNVLLSFLDGKDEEDLKQCQRLEFLGDSTINLLTVQYLYDNFNKDEGFLSKMKAMMVSKQSLATVFDDNDMQSHTCYALTRNVRLSEKVKADYVEICIGIMFCDGKRWSVLKKIFKKYLLNSMLSVFSTGTHLDYKSLVQSFSQKEFKQLPVYTVTKHEKNGGIHNFTVQMTLYTHTTNGTGKNTLEAEQVAAREMAKKLNLSFFDM